MVYFITNQFMDQQISLKDLATSIEDLAIMTKEGFERMDSEFLDVRSEASNMKETMRVGFERNNQRFDEIDHFLRTFADQHDTCRQHRALTDARLSRLETLGG